jgi:predicted nucleotidyltransferase
MINVNIPKRTLKQFCERYQVKRLALFGSVLRSDFRPDSDVDVLVVFEPTAEVTFMTLGRMKRELSMIFDRPVDLVPQEGLKPAIRNAVIADSKEVYAA